MSDLSCQLDRLYQSEIDQLRERNRELSIKIAELRQYVAHKLSCRASGRAWPNMGPCDCGLEEAKR